MSIFNRKEALTLGLGDTLLFLLALLLTLAIRYGNALTVPIFYAHIAPFSLLIIIWLFVFFITGLYEKHTLLLQRKLPSMLLRAVLTNTFFSVIFFYFITNFGIAPKVNLFLCLFLSFAFILTWRTYGYRLMRSRRKQNAIIIGGGEEFRELADEVNRNDRYGIRFVASIQLADLSGMDFKNSVVQKIQEEDVSLVVLDLKSEEISLLLPHLYTLIFRNVQFVDIHKLYEDIFDRIPLSLVTYDWFLEHSALSPGFGYDVFKRSMDIILSFILGIASLVLYPFVFLLIKLDDAGPLFIFQERVGVRGKIIRTIKFRTMMRDDSGVPQAVKENKPTRVGPFLRRSRIDELPQFWNVLKGDLSLIGPRPELPSLVKVYEETVPYYNVRTLIKPGLSGWAQIYHDNHPHHEADVKETRTKLSYDLYYMKNRSLFLDLKIALKTIKTLLSRSGL